MCLCLNKGTLIEKKKNHPVLTSTVRRFVRSSSDGGTVVLRAGLAFCFSFLVHVESNVAIYACVSGVVAVSTRGTVH